MYMHTHYVKVDALPVLSFPIKFSSRTQLHNLPIYSSWRNIFASLMTVVAHSLVTPAIVACTLTPSTTSAPSPG